MLAAAHSLSHAPRTHPPLPLLPQICIPRNLEAPQEFVSLAFSADGKYLAAQAGAPDWTLALWVWEKSKLVATAKSVQQPGQTAVQCLFQPGVTTHQQGLGQSAEGGAGPAGQEEVQQRGQHVLSPVAEHQKSRLQSRHDVHSILHLPVPKNICCPAVATWLSRPHPMLTFALAHSPTHSHTYPMHHSYTHRQPHALPALQARMRSW